jgi:phosphoinositide-3-kinase, regulatory subunit 4
MLLTRFGVLLNDSMILQRVVPFVMLCIEDHIAIVRATSIRCLRSLLSAVTEVSQIDSSIFKDFLFPTLNNVIARDNEAIVRVAFAESIGRFAETSMRFLDASRFNTQIKLAPSPAPIPAAAAAIGTGESGGGAGEGEGEMTSSSPATAVTAAAAPVFVEGSYDTQVNVLHDQVSKWIRDLVLDGNLVSNDRSDGRSRSAGNSHSSVVKRAILEDIVRLCVFFGKQERIMDLFAQLLAYVNHTVCFPLSLPLVLCCSDYDRIGILIGNSATHFVSRSHWSVPF